MGQSYWDDQEREYGRLEPKRGRDMAEHGIPPIDVEPALLSMMEGEGEEDRRIPILSSLVYWLMEQRGEHIEDIMELRARVEELERWKARFTVEHSVLTIDVKDWPESRPTDQGVR